MPVLRAAPLALLLAATAAPAQQMEAPLPPLVPWSGASERLIAPDTDPWITPAETAKFVDTPDYAATRAWLDRLVASAPHLLSIQSFGKTAQGRDLYYVRASKGGAGKPVLLAQGGIHSGEIDGKDAGMMLLRDIAHRGKDQLLDNADLVFVPIFNADGHERSSPWNRPNQRGPQSMGWRTTAQNLNLNRDYLKADAPEMQAMIALIGRLDPVLYLDLHVTDGTDHQYDVAYAFSGWNGLYAQSPAIGRWLDKRLRPTMDAALKRAGHTPGYYVNARDNRDPSEGIAQDPETPRFSTGYGDYRHLPTVLLETHSLKPYRQRVLGTYIFIEEALRLVGSEGARLRTAINADRAVRPKELIVSWKPIEKPITTVDFLGIAYDRYYSAASGREEIRWLGRPVVQKMPVFGQAPARRVTLPKAWWVPATAPDVIERLRLHGVRLEAVESARTVAVDMVRITAPKLEAASEGHVPLSAGGFVHAIREERFPPGSVRVPADQPLGLLAAALLEAESSDGVLAWNFFPAMLQRTEYIEAYAIASLAERMLAQDSALKRQFEAKLAAEPTFAADGNARLAWFYERTPYFDDRYLLYPIGREQ